MQSKESQKKTIASRSQSIDEFLVNSRLSEDQSKKESRENYASAAPEKINQHERNIRINEPEPTIRSDHKSIVLQPDDDCNNWWKQPVTTYASVSFLISIDLTLIQKRKFFCQFE